MHPTSLSKNRRSLVAAVLSVAALAAFTTAPGCKKPDPEKPAPAYSIDKDMVKLAPGAPRPVSFATAKAELGEPLEAPPITGRVTTVEALTAPSYAPLAGHITEVRVRLGDRVQEGDKLVKIRTQDLSTLSHDVRAASLSIKTKQAIVDRTKMLVDNRAATQNDLLVAQSELDQAKLEATSAGAKIESLSVKAEDDTSYWIVATRSGTVVEFNVTPGQEVGPDKDRPIATIASLDDVIVVGDLRPKEAGAISIGDQAQITFTGAPGVVTPGEVETISEVVDPNRQTVPLRIRAKNPKHSLKPNGYVDITFKSQNASKVVLVPSVAIVSDGADSVVFVEKEPGQFQKRPVQVRRAGKEKTEIVSGLQEGESVVTVGALLLLNSLDVEG